MLRKVILAVVAVLAAGMIMYVGCSSDGNGGGEDGQKDALSLNADTALPAAGGAAISTEFGTRIAATVSAVFQQLAESSGDASSTVRPKGNFDAFCAGGGSADLTGIPVVGRTATLTLEGCEGSPLSGTAANGILIFNITAAARDLTEISANASFAGLEDDGVFTIESGAADDPNTEITGDMAVTMRGTPNIFRPNTVDVTLGNRLNTDLITVSEGGRSLQVGCFEIEQRTNRDTSSDDIEVYAIEVYKAVGVLSLDEQVYTLNSYSEGEEPPDIEFPADSAVPDGGTLTLYSGDNSSSEGCAAFAGIPPGDNSRATAEFMPEGRVSIDVDDGDGECSLCTTTWENLLNTLSDIASPDSCEIVSCSGTGGSGGTAGSGGTGGTGGGTGGTGGSVGRQYCVTYTDVSNDTCFPTPEFREVVTLDVAGSTITYTMTVGGLPTAPPPNFPTEYDFDVDAAGTLSGLTATGTGDTVTGTATQDPACAAPEARLSFNIEFGEATLDTYQGTINLDFTLDPSCGSSICFASASVEGGPCQ